MTMLRIGRRQALAGLAGGMLAGGARAGADAIARRHADRGSGERREDL